jgi:hypothetical protein
VTVFTVLSIDQNQAILKGILRKWIHESYWNLLKWLVFFFFFFLAKHFLCQNKIRLYNALEIISRPCLNFADTTICWDKFCTLHSYHVWLRHGILEPEPLKDNIHILAEYTATDGCLLCSKVDLMEEDRSRQVLEPTQNPAMEAVFQ